jgi:3-hydroxyacyl-CoA dehydrogenase
MKPIRNVAVLGAGVMGSGIAAHLANAGIPALLLDIVQGASPLVGQSPTSLPQGASPLVGQSPTSLPQGASPLVGQSPTSLAPPDAGADRDKLAAAGLENALKAKPAAFFHASRARLVTVGNLEDDLGELARYDLVIEAVLERLDVKRALFARLEAAIGEHTIVSSNTSGLPIAQMMEGRSPGFRRRFLVTHFFNPPRYMKLLELVAGPDTDPAVFARARRFGEDVLGKGIVVAKDTPNFVGNRIGAYALMVAIHQMLADGLDPEDVDAIVGEPLGRPRSAAFRTADVVGVDTFVHVADNCHAALVHDEEREVFAVPAYIRQMVDRKLLGDKTKGGFYRKGTSGAIETLDPRTGEYRPRKINPEVDKTVKRVRSIEDPVERVRALLADPGPAGRFAWRVSSRVLAYAARRIPEVADDFRAVDDAMRWGYSWDLGPFESWDALGFEATRERIVKDGLALPAWVTSRSGPFYAAGAAGAAGRPRIPDPNKAVCKNGGGAMWDLGDGVAAVTLATKANSVDPEVIALLGQAVERAEADFRALVLYNTGDHFSVGANLYLVAMAAGQKSWDQIRALIRQFQAANQRLKYAAVPVVAAPHGMTVGGGLEMCLGAGSVQAAAETYAGLVEVGVGLIPGGGGTMNLLWRAFEAIPEGAHVNPYALVTQVFLNIALAKVATSADEAKAFGYFRPTDGVSFDAARLLADAKARAIGLAESGWHPPAPRAHVLPGDSGIATLNMMVTSMRQAGQASEHDAKIALKLAEVLCGGTAGSAGPVTEERMLELECEAFLSLCGEPKTQERMQHMLMNNKPLRN